MLNTNNFENLEYLNFSQFKNLFKNKVSEKTLTVISTLSVTNYFFWSRFFTPENEGVNWDNLIPFYCYIKSCSWEIQKGNIDAGNSLQIRPCNYFKQYRRITDSRILFVIETYFEGNSFSNNIQLDKQGSFTTEEKLV